MLRRIVFPVVAALVLGLVLASSSHAAPTTPALEVSNSCVGIGTTSQLVIWGSNLSGGTLTDFGLNGVHLFPPVTEPAGNFTTVETISPTVAGLDTIELAVPGAIGATRSLLVVFPQREPCPTTAPPPAPCLPGGLPVPVSVTGLRPFLNDSGQPDTLADTTWFLDYRGENAGQPHFATSPDTVNGTTDNSQAVLPASLATPGAHMVTALSQPQAFSVGPPLSPPFALGPDDVYTTFPVTICQPPPPTTTTGPTVPTTTPTTGTTATTTPTTPTTGPPIITVPTIPTPSTLPPLSPTLTVNPAVGFGGEVTQVHGSGFPPGSTVTLEWLTGIGTVATKAAADGTFTVALLVFPHDQIGVRFVHARGYPASVSARFLNELGPEEPPAASNGQWIFREG
jgi:hypothetical protein